MRFVHLFLAAALAVLVMHSPCCAGGPGGGQQPMPRPDAQGATQIICAKLKELRMDPSRKPAYLQMFREKAEKLGGGDQIDMRMGQIDGLMEQALRLGDSEFWQSREQIARRIWYWMSGE